ncbi:MAG: flippase-like domain-containing protein, partial [Flavobacteriales bacterium]|nr:flippase-like domain-containing protein [Flavobacteriales bacterium]
MKKAVVGILKVVVPLGLGVWLVFYFYDQLDEGQRAELFDAFGRANWWWLLLSVLLGWCSHMSRSWR